MSLGTELARINSILLQLNYFVALNEVECYNLSQSEFCLVCALLNSEKWFKHLC